MWKCKHCLIEFENLSSSEKANHSRWCKKNPDIEKYIQRLSKIRNNIASESRSRQSEKIKLLHESGRYFDAPKKSRDTKTKNGTLNLKHTNETKQLLREKALNSTHRRILKSTRIYVKKDGTKILLDSSWEEALAKRLDNLCIDWIRPNPIKWMDKQGVQHNYFPDFYLPQYDIYLDPKNEQVYKLSLEKIQELSKILPNLIILKTLKECEEFKI
jgi:hypothetical protein